MELVVALAGHHNGAKDFTVTVALLETPLLFLIEGRAYTTSPREPRAWRPSTCLSTRLEESSLVPAGFLTAQFLQKTSFMKPLFILWETGWCFFYYISGGKGKY